MKRLGVALLAALVTTLTVAPSFAGDSTIPAALVAGKPGTASAPLGEPDDRTPDVSASPRLSPDANAREKDRLLMLLLLLGIKHPLQGR